MFDHSCLRAGVHIKIFTDSKKYIKVLPFRERLDFVYTAIAVLPRGLKEMSFKTTEGEVITLKTK